MTDAFAVDALIGALLPLVIALVNQAHWDAKVKGVVALAACAAAATLAEVLRGALDWSDWRNAVVVIGGAAFLSYKTLWQPSTIAPALEQATTLSRKPARTPAA